jgi:four helix bundle protein
MAVDLAVKFHLIAERVDKRRLYRYAEQLRAAGLSISNNIAEGSGSTHQQEFIQFLNITRRSLFEDASMKGLAYSKVQRWINCCGIVTRRVARSPAFRARSDTAAHFALCPSRLPLHRLTICIAQSG